VHPGPTVLGINAAHDAAVCVMVRGRVVAAVAEERLTRVKHQHGLPTKAVEYCLGAAGLGGLDAVELIVLNEFPMTDFALELRNGGFGGELVVNPSHHLLHAYYAWVASGFREAAILITDGSGYGYGEYERRQSPLLGAAPPYSEMEEAESLYVADGSDLSVVVKRWGLWDAGRPFLRFPSLGHMYSMASQYIFGGWEHAGKTMGLAPYGDASRFPDPIVECDDDGLTVDTLWITKLPERSAEPAHLDSTCRDVAAKVQAELERGVLHLCKLLHRATGQSRLCLSGGVGLNTVTNGRILRETPFSELFVTPAAGDTGIAVGAALYGHRRLEGESPEWQHADDFHGREYSDEELEAAIDARRGLVRCERVADAADAAAADVAGGAVIGWFEGGSELGPRALGHRSTIADPRDPRMRDHLNEVVKFREPFRPYAASVLAEHAREYFDLLADDPFMLVVASVLDSQRAAIPSVCHVDGTCRVQTVPPEYRGRYRRMIERFHARTGVPLVLNTSLNIRGEPIVETPDDALGCFLSSSLDVLYLGDRRIEKLPVSEAVAGNGATPDTLIPTLNESILVAAVVRSKDGAALPARYHCRTRTGQRATIDEEEFRLLALVDGRRTIAEIAGLLSTETAGSVAEKVLGLQQRGFVALRVGHQGE
jgi:carbamoyltransferase